jgi:hypothetical protein
MGRSPLKTNVSTLFAAAALIGAGVTCVAAATVAPARLVVSYCPTDFTNHGAIVDVDPLTGAWTIETKFRFPDGVFGCSADYTPSYTFDPNDSHMIWFDFTSNAGYFVGVDLRHGNTTTVNSNDAFFTGFLDFAEWPSDQTLRGITSTVTESGYCSDACVGFGTQDLSKRDHGKYRQLATLPFRETADDARYVDRAHGVLYFQAAYDLNNIGCAPQAFEQCMLAVNTTDGSLLSAKYSPQQYQVFKYGRGINDGGSIVAFMEGFNSFCGVPANGSAVAFGSIHFVTAIATPTACVPQSIVIDTDDWIASYSHDESILATASGNGEGDPPQFVAFNVSTGVPLVNTQLTGLPAALGADMGLIFIWGVEFAA